MDKSLDIALGKLRYHRETKEWYATLGYAEVIALYKDGYRSRNEWYDYVKNEQKRGHNSMVNVSYYKTGKNKPKSNLPFNTKEN